MILYYTNQIVNYKPDNIEKSNYPLPLEGNNLEYDITFTINSLLDNPNNPITILENKEIKEEYKK